MSTIDWNDVILEFYEVCIHNLLYAREVYPRHIFENRRYLGASVWQSRHPDINAYIRRVLDNAKPLLIKGLVDRMVFAVDGPNDRPYDHVTLKCVLLNEGGSGSSSSNKTFRPDQFKVIEEELRSSILRICMTDATLGKLPPDCNWKIQVITRPSVNSSEEDVVKTAMTTGEWYVDNNQTPQNLALAQRVQARAAAEADSEGSEVFPSAFSPPLAQQGSSSASTNPPTVPKLKPLKSFRDHQINLTLYAHVFHS